MDEKIFQPEISDARQNIVSIIEFEFEVHLFVSENIAQFSIVIVCEMCNGIEFRQ